MDTALFTFFLSELNGIFTLKAEQRTTLKVFLDEKHDLALLPSGISNSFVKRGSAGSEWTVLNVIDRNLVQLPFKAFIDLFK